ncbi:MAG: insulinase family protein [Lachnospiraceae bacterium]|nr:insulinase family protein [Lachnospiraceae bacterium]
MDMEKVSAYELCQHKSLTDIHSEGYYLVHKKTGAKVVAVTNNDPNKVFYIGFRTPPRDSTGVPHIIEHSVLCGSEKFPLKDPFIELAKGSLNTFLNAMTYPDKTVYPIASCNDRDFQNLMDVYMDAVLHPNIYKEQNIFRQEGWHYEMTSPEDDLTLNGVVYNEMKGAYSSGDSVVERGIMNALYPDTPYSNESGGDPDVIPDLTYEQFLDFHATYYHPSNSYIYLYGDMDAAEKLAWLDAEYLSHYEKLELDSSIPVQPAFDAPVKKELSYSISSGESEKNNTYLSYNWSVGTALDPLQYVAFDILSYALLTSQGAPVKQALIDAGIGEDIYGGYDSGILQPTFSVIAKNANAEQEEEFERIIRNVLAAQVRDGINKTTLLAAINGAEFKFREADFGRIPKGLMFGLQMMDSWLYDGEQPFLHMEELRMYEELRQKLNTGYFEELVQTYLLDNPHAVKLCAVPRKGLNAQKDQALQEKLNQYRDSLGAEEIGRLIEDTRKLEEYHETPSTKEELDTIPLLSRDDMKKVSDPYSNVEETAGQIPFLWHDYDTNGIIYLDYLFDVRHIPEKLVPYLSVLKMYLGRLDTKDYPFVDLTNEINFYTGGISADVMVVAVTEGEREYEAKFEIRIRTLEANLTKAMELAKSIMTDTLFEDEKRMYELLAMTKSRLQSDLREGGSVAAMRRAMSCFTRREKYNDLLAGIGQYRLLEELVSSYDAEKDDLKAAMRSLVEQIMQPSNLTVSCTCERSGFDLVKANAALIADGLRADTEKTEQTLTLPDRANEGFMDASQIQYVALAGNFNKSGIPYRGALRVYKCIMNYEYLWQNIRVRGGAYGCGTSSWRTGDVAFYSYRDPNLSKTLEVYRGVADYLRSFDVDERDMTRYVIGAFSEMDAPLTPSSMGRRSLTAYLSGTAYEMLQQERDEVLTADQKAIRGLAPLMDAVLEDAYICVIGNEEKLREEAGIFDSLEAL